MRGSRRRALPWLVLLFPGVLGAAGATSVHADPCAGSFLGCRTRRQQVRFCHLACRSYTTICTSAFRRGGLRTGCRKDLVSSCIGQGGTCDRACGPTTPCPVNHQCFDGQCVITPPDRCGGGVCPLGHPNCGPDGRCWQFPCTDLCGADNCCGGDFPACGGDGLCHAGPAAGTAVAGFQPAYPAATPW